MFIKSAEIFIEKLENGFLGHKVNYFLWISNKYCGHSLDGINWKLKFNNINKKDFLGREIS